MVGQCIAAISLCGELYQENPGPVDLPPEALLALAKPGHVVTHVFFFFFFYFRVPGIDFIVGDDLRFADFLKFVVELL